MFMQDFPQSEGEVKSNSHNFQSTTRICQRRIVAKLKWHLTCFYKFYFLFELYTSNKLKFRCQQPTNCAVVLI